MLPKNLFRKQFDGLFQGLLVYCFTPFFTAVYNQEWLIFQTIYVVHEEILL